MDFLLVGIGGIFGSIARYDLGRLISQYSKSSFPYTTFIINIIGALLLGAVSARHGDGRLYLLLGEGFMGAFTTFSTFMYEGVCLIRGSKHVNALIYIAATVILGCIGFVIGYYYL
jgi:CrcB protein